MATKVLMEALSPTMEEGQVTKWMKGEGDEVVAGDTLAEVETDKAIMELVARGSGVLRRIIVPEGKAVEVGSLVAVIAAADEDISAFATSPAAPPQPTPAGGETAEVVEPVAEPAVSTSADGDRIKASPIARRIASERGIDLAAVHGSGPGGRIVKSDVEHAEPPAPSAPTAPEIASGGFEDVPLTQIRKAIAKRLGRSIGPIPHFFLTTEIDMERAAEARAELNTLDAGPKISYNDMVLKVVAAALTQHRACNAWWQDDHIRLFHEVHVGVAVAVDDGLITPVVRNADLKTLRQIAADVLDLAQRAREKRLRPEEYTGGTFTVSNLGMYDIDQFTGVINPPEAGLLAVGSVIEKPVVHDGQVVVRRRMRVTMSCDHRVIDGATGALFLQTVRRMLENPLAIVW
jgi:pyruvate dehydrogenase E2 component (dihydrolipoamide acetyltransferase)